MKARNQALRLRQAVDLLHRPDTRLMLMHTRDGDEFCIVPGGRLDTRDALKILERPDVRSFDDGLFPGHSQQWRPMREQPACGRLFVSTVWQKSIPYWTGKGTQGRENALWRTTSELRKALQFDRKWGIILS